MRRITPQLCAQVFCISLFLIFSSTLVAQVRPSSGPRPVVGSREWPPANVRNDLRPNINPEQQARILLTVLKDDFRKLQIINNDLMQRTLVDARTNPDAISSKEIRSSLREMQKRADRLRTNLRLPDIEILDAEVNHELVAIADLSTGLLLLDQTVMNFVENPVFQRPGVLDAQQSTIAARDLNKVLRLTDVLRKLAKADSSLTQLARQDSK